MHACRKLTTELKNCDPRGRGCVYGNARLQMVDGKPEPCAKVPFGYTDGISMTTIRGGPEKYATDHQEACEPWLLVLQD
jgi:hypothetical protein